MSLLRWVLPKLLSNTSSKDLLLLSLALPVPFPNAAKRYNAKPSCVCHHIAHSLCLIVVILLITKSRFIITSKY